MLSSDETNYKGKVVSAQAAQAYTAKLAKRRHYNTLYWEFTRFSKILEYCYYCGNKFYLPSVHRVLVCCVHFGRNLRSFRARTPRTVLPYKFNYTEGWFLHTPFASRSQSHVNKMFSWRDSSSPNATKSTYS